MIFSKTHKSHFKNEPYTRKFLICILFQQRLTSSAIRKNTTYLLLPCRCPSDA